jgi:hypothetical protein
MFYGDRHRIDGQSKGLPMLKDDISQSGSSTEGQTAPNPRTQARKFQWKCDFATYFTVLRFVSCTKENGADWDGMEPLDMLRGWQSGDW